MWWWIILTLALLVPVLLVILDSDVARSLSSSVGSRRDRARLPEAEPEGVRQRLDHLEGEVDRLSDEVHRLEEESRFLHELLADRARSGERPSRRDEDR